MPLPRTYLDESGDLSSGQPVILAGVVWRRLPDADHLRRQLQLACPSVPFPLHAAHLDTVSFRAFADHGDAPEHIREAGRLLRGVRAPAVQEVRQALQHDAPWRVGVPAYRAVDRWMQANRPDLHQRLARYAEYEEQRLWRVLDDQAEHAFAIAAWHGEGARSPEARYLELLDALCERLGHLRVQSPPPATLVQPSRCTWVQDTPWPQGPREVQHPRGRHVIWLHPPDRYGARSHPAFYLADFVANRLLRVTRRGPWSTVTRRWPSRLPLVVAGEGGDLPTITACGPARSVLGDVAGGLDPQAAAVLLEPLRPRWVADQALAWAHALGGAR